MAPARPFLAMRIIVMTGFELIERHRSTVCLQVSFLVVVYVRRGLGDGAGSILLVGIRSSTLLFLFSITSAGFTNRFFFLALLREFFQS